jgi:hypothetical protein
MGPISRRQMMDKRDGLDLWHGVYFECRAKLIDIRFRGWLILRTTHNCRFEFMAKLSDLVLRSSEVTGVPVATVREISRRLREAELISTGKGGRYGGADMTPGDAASLLTSLLVVRASAVSLNNIALLTKSHLQDLTSHENSPSRWSRPIALPQLRRLKLGHTFGDAFSALIESISNGDMERAIKKWTLGRPHGTAPYFNLTVRVNNPSPNQEAAIGFVTSAFEQWMVYLRRRDKRTVAHPPSKWSDVDNSEIGLRVLATIQESELKAIGLLLRNSETTHA